MHPRPPHKLLAEHNHHITDRTGHYRTAKIGPWQLSLNPTSYRDTTSRVHQTVQTADGYGRFSYGFTPNTYTLEGTTGNAGVTGPGGINDLDQLRPQLGRADKLYEFYFPGRFTGVRRVRINQLQVTQDAAQGPYFYYYTIELEEGFRTPAASARRVTKAALPALP